MQQLETEKGVSKDKIIKTIEDALSAAYKKDYGKSQIVHAKFNPETGEMSFAQIKYVVDESMLKTEEDESEEPDRTPTPPTQHRVRFEPRTPHNAGRSPENKKERPSRRRVAFPAGNKRRLWNDKPQTAKQVIIQRIREAEKESIYGEFKNAKEK